MLETLSCEGIASLSAAASLLIESHVSTSDGCGRVDCGIAIAAEGSLSIDDNIVATAIEDAAVSTGEVLAEGERRVGDTADAGANVLSSINSVVEA